MTDFKTFFLEKYLPTTSNIDRELWFRTNETAQRFVEIGKDYAEMVADEYQPDFDTRIENIQYIDRIKNQI